MNTVTTILTNNVTDVQMPGINGYETTRRSRVLRPALPVIGLTAYALPEEKQRCLDAGMSGHVTKPVDIDSLVAAILRLVRPGKDAGTEAPATAPDQAAPDQAALETPPPVTVPTVDWPTLEKRLVKASILRKTLESLLEHHQGTPAELRRLMTGTDPEPVRLIAHNLRGVAGILAAKPAQVAAEALENAIRDTRTLEPEQVDHLADIVDTLLAEVRAYLARTAPLPTAAHP